MARDSLGDRMKSFYEERSSTKLMRRTPVILRLDGKAFHTFTRGFRPFLDSMHGAMVDSAHELMSHIQGAKMGYVQSDEISILVTDYDNLTTEAWFDYKVQKMCSVSASIVTSAFNRRFTRALSVQKNDAFFDCRAFNVPLEEVVNYFYWRWCDWERNSIQMLAQSHFSHKELHGKNRANVHDMLMLQKNVNWNDLAPKWKNGTFVDKNGTYNLNLRTDRELFQTMLTERGVFKE